MCCAWFGSASANDVAGIGLVVVVFFVDGVVVGVLRLAVEVGSSAGVACGGAGIGRRSERSGSRRAVGPGKRHLESARWAL